MVETDDCDGELTYFTHAAEIEEIVKEIVSDYANPSSRRQHKHRSDLYPRFRSVVRIYLIERYRAARMNVKACRARHPTAASMSTIVQGLMQF